VQSLGGDIWRMIAQESTPSLAWRPPSLEHVLRDARLRDFKPELEQLAVDAAPPDRVLDTYLPDQRSEVGLDLRFPPQVGATSGASSRVFGFEPALRLEWRGQDGQYEK